MITDISLEDDEIDSYEPYLTVGDGALKRPADKITAPQRNTCPIVNGPEDKVYLYLTDYWGHNLNVPQSQGQYGFDLSLFERLAMRVSTSEPAAAKLSSAASDVLAKKLHPAGHKLGNKPEWRSCIHMYHQEYECRHKRNSE